MHRICLHDLPPPPPGKTGWPWDVELPPLPDLSRADGWPTISIVTPSFNQGVYLEETIRSVILQGYPYLEYLVMDGGSRDDSVAIIQKYTPWLTAWVSEPDDGQSDAIQKGFQRVTGEVINWLNSDDYYLPGALYAVAQAYRAHPGNLIAGDVEEFDDHTQIREYVRQSGITWEHFIYFWRDHHSWHQPGVFLPRTAYESVGGINRALHYAMDHDLLCRLLNTNIGVTYLEEPLVRFRLHSSSKTCSQAEAMLRELVSVTATYVSVGDTRSERHRAVYVLKRLVGMSLQLMKRRQYGESLRLLSRAFSEAGVQTSMQAMYEVIVKRLTGKQRG